MTYQLVYSSEATVPMQSDDLEDLLVRARHRNGIEGLSGALVYTDGVFLQILEGERVKVQAVMERIGKDVRHENVTVLREGDVASARFSDWKMAYVSATPAEAARWAGIHVDDSRPDEAANEGADERDRTARFVRDILALLAPGKVGG